MCAIRASGGGQVPAKDAAYADIPRLVEQVGKATKAASEARSGLAPLYGLAWEALQLDPGQRPSAKELEDQARRLRMQGEAPGPQPKLPGLSMSAAALAFARGYLWLIGVRGSRGVAWLGKLFSGPGFLDQLADTSPQAEPTRALAERVWTEYAKESKEHADQLWANHLDGNCKFQTGCYFLRAMQEPQGVQAFDLCAAGLAPTCQAILAATGGGGQPATVSPEFHHPGDLLHQQRTTHQNLFLRLAARGLCSKLFLEQTPDWLDMQKALDGLRSAIEARTDFPESRPSQQAQRACSKIWRCSQGASSNRTGQPQRTDEHISLARRITTRRAWLEACMLGLCGRDSWRTMT